MPATKGKSCVPSSQESRLRPALDNLLNLNWDLPTYTLNEEEERHRSFFLSCVGEQEYDRELTPEEESHEKHRWPHTQAILRSQSNLDDLLDACRLFVAELFREHRFELLAQRAGLKGAELAERPSRKMPYRPELLPKPFPLFLNEYEEQVGGPIVLGARLLLWCIVAYDPEVFGYPAKHTRELRFLPIWFEEERSGNKEGKPRKWVAAEKPIRLLKNAAEEVATSPAIVINGIEFKDKFVKRYNHVVELSKLHSELFKYIWSRKEEKIPLGDLKRDVWGGRSIKDKSMVDEVNRLNGNILKLRVELNKVSNYGECYIYAYSTGPTPQ